MGKVKKQLRTENGLINKLIVAHSKEEENGPSGKNRGNKKTSPTNRQQNNARGRRKRSKPEVKHKPIHCHQQKLFGWGGGGWSVLQGSKKKIKAQT